MIAEFALAVPLLTAAGMTIHSFWNLTHVDLGVRTDHVFGFYVDSVPLIRSPTRSGTNAYYRQLLAGIAAVPGVSHAAAMTYLPLDFLHAETTFRLAGQPNYANPAMRPTADFETVTPDYFATFGIRIVTGRAFTDHDDVSSPKVAMINEAFVNRFLKGVEPLAQRLVMGQVIPGQDKPGPEVGWQIVGVFHDVRSRNSREDNPEIDVPFWQEAYPIAGIGVRTANDPASMIKTVQSAVNAIDSQAGFAFTRTMNQVHDQALANDKFSGIAFGSFALVGLTLAAVGIYGTMAFSVAQRRHEMAVRAALGATPNRIVTLIVGECAVLTCTGMTLGVIGAYWMGRTMQGILFGITPFDFSSVGATAFMLLAASLVACFLPAVTAASLDTMRFLKSE